MTTDLVPAGITEKEPFLRLTKKWFLAKIKKHPNFAKRLIFIKERGTFLFPQLFLAVARTWLELRSEFLAIIVRGTP